MDQRLIIHIDMDAFYPAVEVLDDPLLAGLPVIVGGGRERGVVSSASYEARRFGVRSAQPTATARRLCPNGVFLPVRMARYQEVSRQVFAVFERFTPLVEPLSIDEAFLDMSGCQRLFGPARQMAQRIKEAVFEATGLTASAGVGPNKLLAKIASDLEKPDGLVVVEPGEVDAFLEPLAISRLWGVGQATLTALTFLGARTVGDLKRIPREVLERRFGKLGAHLHQVARGLDERPVLPPGRPKSLGRETTFSEDIVGQDRVRRELMRLAARVGRRLRKKGLRGRVVTLKVKYADFKQVTRSRTLAQATDDHQALFGQALALVESTEAGVRPVRLLGISLSRLEEAQAPEEPSLLAQLDPGRARREMLNQALDRVADRFGEEALKAAALLEED